MADVSMEFELDAEAQEERMRQDIDQLLLEFDLTGDQRLSPEEFFNIIMTLYE